MSDSDRRRSNSFAAKHLLGHVCVCVCVCDDKGTLVVSGGES